MADVVISFSIDERAREVLEKSGISYSIFRGDSPLEEWLLKELPSAQAAVIFPGQKFGKRELEMAGRLKLLIVHGSGLDSVDVEEASRRGVCVANVPDHIAEAVAEHALALTMASLRSIVRGDRIVREGKWVRGVQRDLTGRSLKGIKVGIVGMGRIGSEAARIFSSLESSVSYWDRRRKPEVEHALKISYMELDDLLKTSDVVIVSIALTESTRKLIGKREISMLKKGAILVNVSRGAVVDEAGLIERLETGEIRAALDVFEAEPIGKEHPLSKMENVVLTPHLAGFTEEALRETSISAAEMAAEFIRSGRIPYTAVNADSCLQRR